MQVHQLRPDNRQKSKKRVGRGGKKGTYSGRGNKGQASRAGRKMVPIIRELIKRYPKLKGYRRIDIKNQVAVLNLDVIDKNFNEGESVNPKNLIKKGIIGESKGKWHAVKILGNGKLSKKLIFEGCLVSKTAKDSIEKSGGSIR